MLKVIIADDEERVCRLVQMLVDWDALGMEVAGAASNGLEALELVERVRPDILITDIRMPGCDGLELIERAKKMAPHLEIALISGYAQFEYAQTAIRYDVGGYILKPINKAALTDTLKKLGARCLERAASETVVEKMARDSQKSNELLRGRLIDDLTAGRLAAPTRETLRDEYGFNAQKQLLQTFILKIDCSSDIYTSRSIDVIKKNADEIFTMTVSPLCGTYAFKFILSAGYGVVCYGAEDRAALRRALRECLNSLEARLSGTVGLTLAIGREAGSTELLPQSLRDAQIAVAERLTEGAGRMYENSQPAGDTYVRVNVDGASAAQPPRNAAEGLLGKYARTAERAVEAFSAESADAAADELLSGLLKLDRIRGITILETAISAGNFFIMQIDKSGGRELRREFEENSALCGSAGALFSYLRGFQKRLMEEAGNKLKNEAIRPIKSAKDYILKHYSEPISLDEVCDAIGFSASYFSTLFKKETGEGFSKYLARIRVDRAKELLRETNMPVTEVCAKVGYNDIKHFTSVFKKITDLNPSQYRKLYG